MNIEEICWPVALCLFFSVAVTQFTGCAENADIEKTKQTKHYIDAGCKKTAVMGSQGTYWVCEKAGADNDS